jgi:hypothetical protein
MIHHLRIDSLRRTARPRKGEEGGYERMINLEPKKACACIPHI